MWIGSYNKSSRLQNNFVVVYSFVIATYTNVTFLLVMQGKRPCKTNVKRRLNLSSPRNINTRFLNMLLHVNHRCSRRVFHCKLTHRFVVNIKVQKHYSYNIQIFRKLMPTNWMKQPKPNFKETDQDAKHHRLPVGRTQHITNK